MSVTAEELRELLRYDPETGHFWWREPGVKRRLDRPAGTNAHGYRRISIRSRIYQAHRLAWLYVHGVWPSDLIDHINGDRADNRLANLREATHQQNLANMGRRPNNSSGLKGIHYCTTMNNWRAQICVQRRRIHLGRFPTKELAHEAYLRAAEKHFGEFARAE